MLDHTREGFKRGAERYDLIVDIPGDHSLADCRRALTPEGTYVLSATATTAARVGGGLGSLPRVLRLVAMSPFVGQLPPAEFSMPDKQAGLAELNRFVEAGRLTPVTDRTYPLSEVPAAILYLAEGSARDKVVIAI